MGGLSGMPNAPNLQNWVYFGQFSYKSTQFAPNWVLFAEKWYRDGSQNHAFRGIEIVEILNSTLSIPVQIFFEETPPGLVRQAVLELLIKTCKKCCFYQ